MKVSSGPAKYFRLEELIYFSNRYKHFCTVPAGYGSDGATGAFDIDSESWWVHDVLSERGTWDDGTPINNFQASTVLADILWREGRWFRSMYWWAATYAVGGDKARENGMMPWS